MNTKQAAYIDGFVKRASEYGLTDNQAIQLLKSASGWGLGLPTNVSGTVEQSPDVLAAIKNIAQRFSAGQDTFAQRGNELMQSGIDELTNLYGAGADKVRELGARGADLLDTAKKLPENLGRAGYETFHPMQDQPSAADFNKYLADNPHISAFRKLRDALQGGASSAADGVSSVASRLTKSPLATLGVGAGLGGLGAMALSPSGEKKDKKKD